MISLLRRPLTVPACLMLRATAAIPCAAAFAGGPARHMKRFGDYLIDVEAIPDPYEIELAFAA